MGRERRGRGKPQRYTGAGSSGRNAAQPVREATRCPWCPAAKMRYRDATAAKLAARTLYGKGHGLHPYRCSYSPDGIVTWHLGHQPPAVVEGRASRALVYPRQQPTGGTS